MRVLRSLVAVGLAGLVSLGVAQQAATVRVDLGRSQGPWKPITNWFGYDELNYTTTAHGGELLRELAQTSPLPVYIRAHHLLTSGDGRSALKWGSTNVYTVDAAGRAVYDFTIVDRTFDAWLAAGVRPMVELGFMPEAMASGTNAYYLAYPHTIEGSVQSPPKDYAAWGELCRRLVAHLVERYGAERVSTWYFEVWNEPNIPYWHGTEAEYLRLYDYAVAGVRSALPGARVGGPATTSPRSKQAAEFLDGFLKHVAKDRSAATGGAVPLDFISFHIKGSPTLVQEAGAVPHVRMGLDKELTDADRGFALIAGYPQFRALPIILSEADPEGCAACSAKENPANGYRNGPLYAAYTAATMKALLELQDKYQVNLLGMLSWSFEFEGRAYFEGFRTLATNGVDKPVLNVFRMAGQMAGERVAATSSAATSLDALLREGAPAAEVDALATRQGSSARVMLWSYRDDDVRDDDLQQQPATAVTVEIAGLPKAARSVRVEAFTIDGTHSNAYARWLGMGSPQQPTAAQYAELKRAGGLQAQGGAMELRASHGRVTVPASLAGQATTLLRVIW